MYTQAHAYKPYKSTPTKRHFTHDFSQAAIMSEAALSLSLFFRQLLVVFKPAYFLLIIANGLQFRGSAGKRGCTCGCYLWGMVRVLEAKDQIGKSEVFTGDAVTPASVYGYLFICVCLCVFMTKEKDSMYLMCTDLYEPTWKKTPIKNKTRERGKGQRVEVIMLQGIWRSDLLCEVVKVWKVKGVWILQELVRTQKIRKKKVRAQEIKKPRHKKKSLRDVYQQNIRLNHSYKQNQG